MIYRWVNKFRTHGTVHNLNRKDTNRQSHSGRPKSSRTPHNVAAVIMCQWFCDKIDAVQDFLDNVWFSDVAYFLFSGHMNSKNNIFWSSTTPEHCLQRPLHSVKCTAWVAISKQGIIGPFWFEDDNRDLCPPDPNVPAAPGSSFGAYFLSASETKHFCSTDLKLRRCLLHRLDLM